MAHKGNVRLFALTFMYVFSPFRQKKAANGHPAGDHENLMNGVSLRFLYPFVKDQPQH